MTRYVKIKQAVYLEQLYVKVTCPYCEKQYSVHMRKAKQPRVCPCARGTFYFEVEQYRNYIGFNVFWIGPFEQRVELEVDSIEVAKLEDLPVYTREEIDDQSE